MKKDVHSALKRNMGRIRLLGLGQRRRLARLGAMASVASERAHRWTPETARAASMKAAAARTRAAASRRGDGG